MASAAHRRRLGFTAAALGCFPAAHAVTVAGSLGQGRMQGKAAIVTGGANGIGRATALVLSEQGCAVTIADRDVETGEQVAAYIRAAGGRSTFVETDVSSEASINRLVATAVATYGRLDALVNVAGVNILARLLDTTVERWDAAMQINLRSVFMAIKASLPHLMKHGNGAVVSVSSIQGTRGFPNFPAYAVCTVHSRLRFACAFVRVRPGHVTCGHVCVGGGDAGIQGWYARADKAAVGGLRRKRRSVQHCVSWLD